MSSSSPAPGVTLEQRVQLHQARLFFSHSRGNVPSLLAAALLIAAVLLSAGTSAVLVTGWFSAVLVAAIAVVVYGRQLAAVEITVTNRATLLRKRVGLGIPAVMLCGISGFFMPAEAPLLAHAFLFLILAGIVTVAALGYSVMPVYYLTLNGVTMVPLTLHFVGSYFQRNDINFLLLAVLAIAWQVSVLKKALRVSHSVIEGITLNERLQQEISEHEKAREAIRHMALHDALTGLANRRHFDETLERSLSVAARGQGRFGLLEIDLDDFKPVNDNHGHAVGDQVLQALAERLRKGLRGSDFAARIGGDEFAAIQENVSTAEDVDQVARKLQALLDAPLFIGQTEIHIGASIGVAVYPDDGGSTEELLRKADLRMYQNKQQRKSAAKAALCTPTPH